MAEKIKKNVKLSVGDIVTPRNLNAVINDNLLHESGRELLKKANYRGIITQIQDDLYYTTYTASGIGVLTQVYKRDEIKLAL